MKCVDQGGTVRCESCGWTMVSSSSTSALGHAKQHHQRGGHEVVVDVHRQARYAAERDPDTVQQYALL